MVTQHTPGPWTLEDDSDEKFSTVGCRTYGRYASIAFLTLPNHTANARLIAASPCLFSYVRQKADNGCEVAKNLVRRVSDA